jgi:ribosome-binding protein aMBF1 (putative translation factor)
MKARNISKTELAKRTKQNNSVITKWLSGTQNFTTDTLEQIGKVLEINLLHNYDAKSVTMEKKVIRKTQIPVKRSYAAVNINSYKRIAQYSFAY